MDFFKKVLFGLILAFIGTSGAMAQNITAVEGESGYLTFNMTPGTHYSFEATQFLLGFIPISYTVQPQVAIWVEDTEGNFIDTLYITDRVRKQDWMFAPSEGRPEALPVWSHLQTNDVDTVSHATPKGESKRSTQLMKGLPPGEYVVKLETNRSYDYNMDYPEEEGIVGQPSLIYQAPIVVGPQEVTAEFVVIGTGSPKGNDGSIRLGTLGITTALELFDFLSIQYTPASTVIEG